MGANVAIVVARIANLIQWMRERERNETIYSCFNHNSSMQYGQENRPKMVECECDNDSLQVAINNVARSKWCK